MALPPTPSTSPRFPFPFPYSSFSNSYIIQPYLKSHLLFTSVCFPSSFPQNSTHQPPQNDPQMPLQPSAAATHGGDPVPLPKPETKVLSLLLKLTIMILLTTLFFVFLGLATALLLIHLCVASALHRRRRHHHRLGSQYHDSSSGFSHRDLKKLLQFRFPDWVNPHSQIDCPICLDGFRNGQWCRKLDECGHVYHRKCIDSWLVRVSACPLCRSCVRLDVEELEIDCVSSQNHEILYAL